MWRLRLLVSLSELDGQQPGRVWHIVSETLRNGKEGVRDSTYALVPAAEDQLRALGSWVRAPEQLAPDREVVVQVGDWAHLARRDAPAAQAVCSDSNLDRVALDSCSSYKY
jgi:hypothetical protein